MDERRAPIRAYRLLVLMLALGFTVYQLGRDDWSSPGGPLRYLTNWALIASGFAALAMVARSLGISDRRRDALVAVAAVMNAVVVIQYWRLYLMDPANVTSGDPLPWWLEYYLHLAGPMLQWFDALVILRAFRTGHGRALGALIGLVVAYALWAEMFVGPMNDRPVGSVTSGLPYPFLNDMALQARLTLYAVNAVVVAVFYAAFVGLARFIPRPPAAP